MSDKSEENLIKIKHRYQVRRIILDKLILGLLLGTLAFISGLYVENFKNSLSTDRFLLENKLKALQEIRDEHAKLVNVFDSFIGTNGDEKQSLRVQYNDQLNLFMNKINIWSMLFSDSFGKQALYHVWMHQAVATGILKLSEEHIDFYREVFQDFENLSSNAWLETIGMEENSTELYKFIKGDRIIDFFNKNFNEWKKNRDG